MAMSEGCAEGVRPVEKAVERFRRALLWRGLCWDGVEILKAGSRFKGLQGRRRRMFHVEHLQFGRFKCSTWNILALAPEIIQPREAINSIPSLDPGSGMGSARLKSSERAGKVRSVLRMSRRLA